MNKYSVSIDENEEWSTRILHYSMLSRIAIQVNAPGNNVFDNGNIELESTNLENAFGNFNHNITEAKNELLLAYSEEEVEAYVEPIVEAPVAE